MKNSIIKLLLLQFTQSADKLDKAFKENDITSEEYSKELEILIENYDYKIREQIRKGAV